MVKKLTFIVYVPVTSGLGVFDPGTAPSTKRSEPVLLEPPYL